MALAQQLTYARAETADPQLLALKVPPHSIEAEQSLLGALLLDNQAFDRVADLVTGEDFYRDDHRRLWRHIAMARFWQSPGMLQLIWMACLPSDQVTILASVRVIGSLPGVDLASPHAAVNPATASPRIQRSVDRDIVCLSPIARSPSGASRVQAGARCV